MTRKEAIDVTQELLRRAGRGDDTARAAILDRYQSRLLRRIRLMMGDQARRAAESIDFLQDVVLEVLQDADHTKVRDEQHLLRWMTAVARNKVRDSVRRRRERAFESLSISAVLGPDRASDSPASQAERHECVERLADALEELDRDHRRVIELRDLEGLPFAEIAGAMSRSEDAVQTLHMRAMVRLGRLVHR